MDKVISVNLPCNTSNTDRHLFEPFASYRLPDLRLLMLNEVFVTHSGLCLREEGLVPESHHSYNDKYQQLLDEAAYYFKKASDDETNLIEFDDNNHYLLIHHPWSSNYWHWLTEAIPRVLMVQTSATDLILVLPESFQKIEFILSSLSPFKFKEIFFIPEGKSLLVRNLWLPQIKPIADSYDVAVLRETRSLYLATIQNLKNSDRDFGDRIYISRKKSQKRRVVNEVEVETILQRYGFRCIYNEDYSFQDQIAIFSRVRILVSIHGAGLSNMLFMKEGASVLELHKRKTNLYDWHSFAFWYMANAMKFQYFHQVCDPVNPTDHFFQADFIVDVLALENNIKLMLNI